MFNFNIVEILIRIPVILIALTVHEFCHGYAAYKLGDSTAKTDGRLSFNPVKHIDPIGLICLLLFRFGWAKPVMVDPRNFRKPKTDMAIVAFAGPLSNFVLSFICAFIYVPVFKYSGDSIITIFLLELIVLNIVLGVFNLLPVPPLDGSKVFTFFLDDATYFRFQDVGNRFGFVVLMIMMFTGITSVIIGPVVGYLFELVILIPAAIFGF